MNVKEIIIKYLDENDFDGLSNTRFDCECSLSDLIPCELPEPECIPIKIKNREDE